MPFAPTDLTNLWAWYKGDAGVTGTSSVISWADQSGNSRTMSIPGTYGSPVKDETAINGLPALTSLLGTQGLATTVNIGPISTATVYIVAKQLSGESAFGAFLGAGDNLAINRFNLENRITGDSGTGSIVAGAQVNITNDVWYTIRLRVTSTTVYISINNGAETSAARDSTTVAGLTGVPLHLFTDASDRKGKKAIAEVLVYTSSYTGNDSDNVEYYLQQKYAHYTWSGSIPTSSSSSNSTSMSKVSGKNVKVQLGTDGTTYKQLICETSHTFSFTRETSSVSTKCDSGAPTVTAGAYSWEISGEGVADFAPTSSQVSYEELLSWAQAGTELYVLLEYPDAGTDFTERGKTIITSLERTAGVNDPVSFSFTLLGNGALTITP